MGVVLGRYINLGLVCVAGVDSYKYSDPTDPTDMVLRRMLQGDGTETRSFRVDIGFLERSVHVDQKSTENGPVAPTSMTISQKNMEDGVAILRSQEAKIHEYMNRAIELSRADSLSPKELEELADYKKCAADVISHAKAFEKELRKIEGPLGLKIGAKCKRKEAEVFFAVVDEFLDKLHNGILHSQVPPDSTGVVV